MPTLEYIHPSKRVKTAHKGIYRRGRGFSVGWRDADGKQRWRELSTLEDAIELKALKLAEREGRILDALATRREIRVRDRADLTDVRDYVRAALTALDKSGVGTTLSNPIFAALYQAEDSAVDGIKRSF